MGFKVHFKKPKDTVQQDNKKKTRIKQQNS